MKKTSALVLSISLVSSVAFAQTTVTLPSVTGNPVPTTTLPNGYSANTSGNNGVQTTGRQSSGNNTMYMVAAGAMGAFFGYKAIGACSSQNYAMCALYTSGALLSVVAITKINKQKKSNDYMADAVTEGANPVDPNGNPTNPNNPNAGNPDGSPGSGDPVANINNNLNRLRQMGVTVNPDGSVTTPDGKTRNFGDMSPGALSRAGMSGGDIKNFMADVKAAQAKADAQARATDGNSEMFGETPGSGGSRGTITTGMPNTNPSGGRSGLDRNPAQVAGMSVSYGGEQIGVGADNIYMMIHRRYNLHREGGGFIDPSLQVAPGP